MAVTRFYKNKLYRIGDDVHAGTTARYHGLRHDFDEFIPRLGERFRLHDGRLSEFQRVVRASELATLMGSGRIHTATLA